MRNLKESVMKETELANTLTAVADEEVNDVWGAIEDKPEEAMASSHVSTRMADDGDQMPAVMTKIARDAKDKEKKEQEAKKTKVRQSMRTLGRNPSNASSSGGEIDCLSHATAFKNLGGACTGAKRKGSAIGRSNSGNGSQAGKKPGQWQSCREAWSWWCRST